MLPGLRRDTGIVADGRALVVEVGVWPGKPLAAALDAGPAATQALIPSVSRTRHSICGMSRWMWPKNRFSPGHR